MNFKKSNLPLLIFYFLISIILIIIVNQFSDIEKANEIGQFKNLNMSDVVFIFCMNFFSAILTLIFAPIGMALIIYVKLIITISQAPLKEGLPSYFFWLITLPHGLIELLILLICLCSTVIWYKHIFNKTNSIKRYYRAYFPKHVFYIFILCVVGAFVEVYVSNRLFMYYFG